MAKIPVNSYVNKIGNYLYKHIDSAYDFNKSANMCNVYMSVYYQTVHPGRRPGDPDVYSDMYEMKIQINITTYQNKIRVNLIEVSPDEQTLDYSLYNEEICQDLELLKKKVINRIQKVLHKWFDEYLFIF